MEKKSTLLNDLSDIELPSGRPGLFWWVMFGLVMFVVTYSLLPGGLSLYAEYHGEYVSLPDWLVISATYMLFIGGAVVGGLMFLAELLRRGRIIQSRHNYTETVARFKPLSILVHVCWLIGISIFSTALLMMPSGFLGDDEVYTPWYILGGVLVFVVGAMIGSIVKKIFYSRWKKRNQQDQRTFSPSPFWRWFSFRWRFDLWICAFSFSAIVVGFALGSLLTTVPPDDFGTADDIRVATGIMIALLAGGGLGMIVGLWTCTQFWRSGEEITDAESV